MSNYFVDVAKLKARIEELTTARANAAGEALQAIDAELNAARRLLGWCEGSTNA